MPVLIKRAERQAHRGTLAAALGDQVRGGLDRRSFLRRSGLVAGSLASLGALPLARMRKAQAGPPPPAGAEVTTRKNICTHCSVGCTVTAEVANGVWIGQEPSFDSPINRGSHCAKGAAVRELVHGDRIPDEARERPMDPAVLGQGHRRNRRQAHCDPREVGPRLGLLAGLLPLCAEMCSTKSLLAGDGEVVADIYKERVATRGYGSGAWGWSTAYRETIES
jgi:Molybdopterin oxidoreductase Fe4S4 domain